MLNDEAADVAAPPAPLDVSAYTDGEGVVHITVRDGNRVCEVEGRANASLEQRFPKPLEVLSELGTYTFRPSNAPVQFTLRIADAKATTRAVPVRVTNLEEDDA